MIIEGTSDRLEERLERLAKLHTDGQLDDTEYRTAKALLLAPTIGITDGTTDDTSTAARARGPGAWGAGLIIAIIVGFTLACLGAAATSLQAPAGPVLCRNGDFVAGNVSERYAGTTSYNMDSACISSSGEPRQLSQVKIIGVLWFEYAVATFVVLVLIGGVVRLVRGISGSEAPDDSGGLPV